MSLLAAPSPSLSPSLSVAADPVLAPTPGEVGAPVDSGAETLLTAVVGAEPGEASRLRAEVVTSHLWLADAISRRYRHRGEDAEDLQQVARIGLIEACARFRPERGSFLAFASVTITGVLKRHFRDHGWTIRPPRRTQELAAEVWQEWPLLAQRMGRVPTEQELARRLGETRASIAGARFANQAYRALSMDAERRWGAELTTSETAEEIDRLETLLLLRGVWGCLDADERLLLRLRFCELWSQAEIAREIGASQMQVSRLLTRVLAKLRVRIDGEEGHQLAS